MDKHDNRFCGNNHETVVCNGKKMMGKNGDRNNEEWRNHSGIIMEYGDSNGIFMGISI